LFYRDNIVYTPTQPDTHPHTHIHTPSIHHAKSDRNICADEVIHQHNIVHLTCLINITYSLNLLKYIACYAWKNTQPPSLMQWNIPSQNTCTQFLLEPLLQLLVYSHLTGLFHQILLQVRPRPQKVSRGESLGYCQKKHVLQAGCPSCHPTNFQTPFTLHQAHFTDFHQKHLAQVMKESK